MLYIYIYVVPSFDEEKTTVEIERDACLQINDAGHHHERKKKERKKTEHKQENNRLRSIQLGESIAFTPNS
jgi:hypothetical protein